MKEGSLFGEVKRGYPSRLLFIPAIIHHRHLPRVQVNLVHDVPCGGTVRAKTHCDLLLLSKKNIIEITQHFPESED